MPETSNSPAVITRKNGYLYVEVSDWWRDHCAWLPCNRFIDWMGYATDTVETEIDGTRVLIQCWKGWCPRFLGNRIPYGRAFPGGVGGEVGIYSLEREFPWQPLPQAPTAPSIDFLRRRLLPIDFPKSLLLFAERFLRHLRTPDAGRWWMPDLAAAQRLRKPVSFSLHHPGHAPALIERFSSATYWTCQWMQLDHFHRWLADQVRHSPFAKSVEPDEYVMRFQVDGKHFIWEGKSPIALDPAYA
jgi:hypothetical protein